MSIELAKRIYTTQKSSSKKRGHDPPKYSLNDLFKWLISQPNFKSLYDNWINSGEKTYLIPSVDRLDNNIGYQFDNIRLVALHENIAAPKGIIKNRKKHMLQVEIDDELYTEYKQIMHKKGHFLTKFVVNLIRNYVNSHKEAR